LDFTNYSRTLSRPHAVVLNIIWGCNRIFRELLKKLTKISEFVQNPLKLLCMSSTECELKPVWVSNLVVCYMLTVAAAHFSIRSMGLKLAYNSRLMRGVFKCK